MNFWLDGSNSDVYTLPLHVRTLASWGGSEIISYLMTHSKTFPLFQLLHGRVKNLDTAWLFALLQDDDPETLFYFWELFCVTSIYSGLMDKRHMCVLNTDIILHIFLYFFINIQNLKQQPSIYDQISGINMKDVKFSGINMKGELEKK